MGKGAPSECKIKFLHASSMNLKFKQNDPPLFAGNKKRADKQHGMDADDDAGWMTGPIGQAPGEEMDTKEAGAGDDAPAAAPSLKEHPGM